MSALLEVRGLEVEIQGLSILRGVDMEVSPGEILGVVGETGAGKSMTARSILDLLPARAGVSFASCRFDGEDFIPVKARRQARGRRIGFVPQRPRGSLNPVFRVGRQLSGALRRLRGLGRREARSGALDLLRSVRITDPERVYRSFPHELSGGMCQRVCIAVALAGEPDLIIADEPTTGLDATLQQQVLELVVEQVSARGASLLLITHDIAVARQTCEQIAVMYSGRVMESGPTEAVTAAPANPYTTALLKAFVTVDQGRMYAIPGAVPALSGPLTECPFAARCERVGPECREGVPELRRLADREAACVKA